VLDAVEHGFEYLVAAHVMPGDLGDGLVHRLEPTIEGKGWQEGVSNERYGPETADGCQR
jgi:hypothetical protein